MSLYLQLGRFSLSIFSFSERLFNWHKRFFRFRSMPALPKLIIFWFIFLLQNGKIFWIQVLQYQVSSLFLRYSQSKSLRLLHLIWIHLHLIHKVTTYCFITILDNVFTKRADISVYHVLKFEYKNWNLVYKKNSNGANM